MISTSFEYHKPKVIHALQRHFIKRKEIRTMMILVNVFALVSVALYALHKISPSAYMIGTLLWLMLMITFLFLLPRMIYRKSATFKDHFDLKIGEGGLTLSNERGSKSWNWSDFSAWMESPHFFHLYINPTSFFLIPKDCFQDEETSMARSLLTKGIPNKL